MLEEKSALASMRADRDAMARKLDEAKQAYATINGLQTIIVEAKAREEALKVELNTRKEAAKVMPKSSAVIGVKHK